MPRYKICPLDSSHAPTEIVAMDGGAVLAAVNRLECGEADVWQDDTYAFSVRLNDSGFWAIFQRSRAA